MSTTPEHCIYCAHFHRHKEVVPVHFFGEEVMEVDSIGGDCRVESPRAHWMTGKAVWPFVTTGHSCSKFTPKQADANTSRE
jgi:hypothetical protein